MRTRENLVEQFSSFIDFGVMQWLSDTQLRQNMERYLLQDSSLTSPEYWGLFFQQQWLNHQRGQNLFRSHLYAYLQEPCYRVAKEIQHNYRERLQWNIQDYFNLGVLELDKILSDFKPQLNTRLYLFASQRLKWRILDRMREVDQTVGFTSWSLLLNSSSKRFREALINQGISDDTLNRYLLAWNYYKEIYAQAQIKRNSKLQKPSPEIWEKIANAYNLKADSPVEAVNIEQWLTQAGQALFRYLSPPQSSSRKTIDEEQTIEIQDYLRAPSPEELQEELEIFLESQRLFTRIYSWLAQEIEQIYLDQNNNLHPEIQLILEMEYLQGLTQTYIGQNISPPLAQFQVSRQLDRFYRRLTRRFLQWSNQNNFSLRTNEIQSISEALEEWLKHYYQNTKNEE